jgi:sialidase-1
MLLKTLLFLFCCWCAHSAPVDVFTAGEYGYFCFKIPALVYTQNGSLLAFAEARKLSCADHTWIDLVVKRSVDNGNSWSAAILVYSNSSSGPNGSNVTIGNAAPVQLRENGRILLPFTRNNAFQMLTYSDDDGQTWAVPRVLDDLIPEQWGWIGTGPPGSIQLASGRVLVPSYHGPVNWDDGTFTHTHVLISDDLGETWKLGGAQSGEDLAFPNECQAAQLSNGTIVLHARTLRSFRVRSSSDDNGATWSTVVPVSGLVESIEGCEGSTITLQDSGGDTLLFSGVGDGGLYRLNLSLYVSTDAGLSYKFVEMIQSGPSGYSSLAQIVPTSNVGILYEVSNVTQVIFTPNRIVFTMIEEDVLHSRLGSLMKN